MRRNALVARVAQRVLEQRIQLDRLADADCLFRVVAHVLVFADQPVRRAGRFLPLELDALLARSRLRVAAFGAGDDDHFMALCLNVERALVDRRLDVVTAVGRQRGFGVGYTDRLCDDARRILVRPDSADHANRCRVIQQLFEPVSAAAARTASIINASGSFACAGSATRCSSWLMPTSTGTV